MAKIKLEGMAFYARHGCFEEERTIGTRFEADCELHYDASEAAATDDLNHAMDYQQVYALIENEMEQPSALLEHLARRILKSLQEHFSTLTFAEVKISKLQPPLGGNIRKVSVVMNTEEI